MSEFILLTKIPQKTFDRPLFARKPDSFFIFPPSSNVGLLKLTNSN